MKKYLPIIIIAIVTVFGLIFGFYNFNSSNYQIFTLPRPEKEVLQNNPNLPSISQMDQQQGEMPNSRAFFTIECNEQADGVFCTLNGHQSIIPEGYSYYWEIGEGNEDIYYNDTELIEPYIYNTLTPHIGFTKANDKASNSSSHSGNSLNQMSWDNPTGNIYDGTTKWILPNKPFYKLELVILDELGIVDSSMKTIVNIRNTSETFKIYHSQLLSPNHIFNHLHFPQTYQRTVGYKGINPCLSEWKESSIGPGYRIVSCIEEKQVLGYPFTNLFRSIDLRYSHKYDFTHTEDCSKSPTTTVEFQFKSTELYDI